MWAILNAPLLIACQMNVIDDLPVKLLVNPEVIDVDQDVAEAPGRIVFETAKTLSSRRRCATVPRPSAR